MWIALIVVNGADDVLNLILFDSEANYHKDIIFYTCYGTFQKPSFSTYPVFTCAFMIRTISVHVLLAFCLC